MSKYIDAEKLKAEIGRQQIRLTLLSNTEQVNMRRDCALQNGAYSHILSIIASLQQEQPIKVYRVENEKEQKGLWRKFDGTWEPLFDMLTDGQCKDMPMEDSPIYREGGKQWFASAPSKETLQKWFSKRDLEELTARGFTISEFEVIGHKKISDFEYVFTRDSIISRVYLKVSDIYPHEQPTKGYDENYLKEKIAKASKTWENVDADKYMDEVRGREQEQQPAEWTEGDEWYLNNAIRIVECDLGEGCGTARWLKSLRNKPCAEPCQPTVSDLAIKFMNYLDRNRPEGKMCLSNGECEDINEAFKKNDLDRIMRYVRKYSWKPSEEQMEALDCIAGAFSPNNKEYKMVMRHINTLRNMLKQL